MNGKALDIGIDEIYFAAVEYADPAARAAYLAEACGTDAELRRQVERLLVARAERGSFLEAPALGPTIDHGVAPIAEGPGTVIGPYKLREQIGEGGMGVVYVAEQTQPVRRKVALKIIKPGMDTKQVIARFEAERQALAMMDHPNIAKVFDAGTTGIKDEGGRLKDEQEAAKQLDSSFIPHPSSFQPQGRPYFVMELVRGLPITEYCDGERLSIRERLELFVLVCRAVQHAHQKGIIHRDLKPSNILVTLHDGVPVPKVIDFGVAKATGQSLTERTVYTAFTQLVGTPLYMSPEQVELSGLDVDTRSDIYSLGVLLYELLTGTTPFDSETLKQAAFDEMRRIIRDEEPPKPSTRLSTLGAALTTTSAKRSSDPRQLSRSVRGELDWIVMKSLEKDRRRRYETANDFAADVMRYLTDQPVEACPPSAGYRLRKFLRRNKGPAAASLALGALLMLGTVGTSIGLVWALRAERTAILERARATAAEKQAKEEASIARAVKDFLQDDLLAEAAPEKNARNKKVTVEEVLGRAAARIASKFDKQPRLEAAIRQTIGDTYRALGVYTAAQPHLESAWKIHRRELGEEHPDTAKSMNNLAALYWSQGQLAKAEPLLVQSLEVSRRVLGEQHPDTLFAMCNLAEVYLGQGQLAKAEPLLVKGLEDCRRVLSEEHHTTLMFMHNLAVLYNIQGQYARAESLLVKTLEVARRVLGQEHPDTLHTLKNLADVYLSQKQFAEAEPLLVQGLEVARRVLGEAHPDTLSFIEKLAEVYQGQGQLAKAETLLVQGLEDCRRVLGEDDVLTLQCKNDIAAWYWRMKKLDRSVPLFEELVPKFQATLGPDHPNTVRGLANLGVNYRDAGRLPQGTALLERAWELAQKRPGPPAIALAWIRIALADAYDRAARFANSERLYGEELEDARKRYGEESPQASGALASLGWNLLKQRKYADAEPLLRECLKIREKARPDDWTTFNTRSLLGGSLLGQKKYVEAEPLLLAGYEGLKQREDKIPPKVRVHLTESVKRLVQLYEAWDQKDKADEWRKKLPVMKAAMSAEPKTD
jgi:serine/threonine protein kinase